MATTNHSYNYNHNINSYSHLDRKSPIITSCQHLLLPNGRIIGKDVADVVLPLYPTILSAIPSRTDEVEAEDTGTTTYALQSIDGRTGITHDQIITAIQEFGTFIHHSLASSNVTIGRGSRIALILPNGPELGLAILCVSQYASCVPLSATGAIAELTADLQRCNADVVIGLLDPSYDAIRNACDGPDLQIPYIGLSPSTTHAGLFTLQCAPSMHHATTATTSTGIKANSRYKDQLPNGPDDEVLVLFTSGTTGNKKLVPHLQGEIITAAAIIALSWNLSYNDTNCNMMPLFHVGGIVRQIYAPLFAGSSVICCPNFDPAMFWTLLSNPVTRFTWYYAAPTMHQLILQVGKDEQYIVNGRAPYPLKMIANAAGGLLPSLAYEMQQVFHGVHVLPSYGMTECMPISSPPYNYNLEKPGTSGVPVGPEVAILNVSSGQSLPPLQEGPICVRGYPCFRGYGVIGSTDSSTSKTTTAAAVDDTFILNGWFNTGDLGYFDEDGYLYITGRSKEVINRGGEIISPMEVEEAVTTHPDIHSCIAFSAPHDVLQEVVGIAIVMHTNRPRIDLNTLHEYLGDQLAAPKWPQCIVFMENGLPKSHTNKLLRVKLGQRLQLPELSDSMSTVERTFEAKCPPQGTGLDIPIPAKAVAVDAVTVEDLLANLLIPPNDKKSHLKVVPHPTRPGSLVCYTVNIDRMKAIYTCVDNMDRYAVPSHFVETSIDVITNGSTLPPPKMSDAVASLLQGPMQSGPVDILTQLVQEMFVDMLNLDFIPIPDANFFHLGGSSMLASQFASRIRKRFAIACSGSEVFQHATANDMAKLIRQRSDGYTNSTSSDTNSAASQDGTSVGNKVVSDHGAPFETERLQPESSLLRSIFQLTPMFIVYPIWQVTRYLLFFGLLLWSIEHVPGQRNIGEFIFAFIAFHTIWITITPLVFVAIKWIVIGRYKQGRYPIWGSYYLRWWFVDICRKLFLRGIYGCNEVTLNWYYRMLGAKIGKNARISLECDVAEFDLVEIGDHAAIEFATLRAFGVDSGAMILGPVKVGSHASLGTKSVVAPHTSIPDNCHLGPVTSSYEVGKALEDHNARVNRRCLPEPTLLLQLFVVGPITFVTNAFGQIPPFFVLYLMLRYKGEHDDGFETLNDLMRWLSDPNRIPYYIGIRVARAVLSPFFYMAAAMFFKKTVIGKFRPGPRNTNNQWLLLRHALAATLFSRKKIQNITDLVGRHYENVSILYRMLGAKVGKRVFWPGQLPTCSGEFDLLEVGDDVVFGSRSSIFFTTIDSCEKVILCAGSNVADNCVVLPGSIIGKNAVLGSNSICPEGWYLPERSVWLGSSGGEPSCLEKGVDVDLTGPSMASEVKVETLQMKGDETTIRPFGKAFYKKQVSYYIWPLELMVAFSFFIKAFIIAFHSLPLLGAIHASAAVLYGWSHSKRTYEEIYQPYELYAVVLFMFLGTNLFRVFLWIVVELTAKWTLIGKRQEGRYNYDTSSYAQRWEIYQLICKIRKFSRLNFLDFFSGTPFMTAYFRWNGGTIGKDVCLYPAGADPFMPEPDLVYIGDRCVVDCASLVCHLNTRGNFELVKIIIEQDCTLRARSRTQQAVVMEEGSQLLEKSLAMTGEVIEANSVWQGCPASWWFQLERSIGDEHNYYDETSRLLPSNKITYYDF